MRERIKRAIADLTATTGRPPTNREIGLYLGGKSTGHIDYHLRCMREQGVITHDARKARGITLVEPVASAPQLLRPVRVPLLGRIAAGRPIEASETKDEFVDLTEGLSFDGEVYALRVSGNSMIEDHIDDGDIVIVRRQESANEGETVVAMIKESDTDRWVATLKRFHRERGGKVRLQPRNSEMAPIIVSARDVVIQGKAIGILRQI